MSVTSNCQWIKRADVEINENISIVVLFDFELRSLKNETEIWKAWQQSESSCREATAVAEANKQDYKMIRRLHIHSDASDG